MQSYPSLVNIHELTTNELVGWGKFEQMGVRDEKEKGERRAGKEEAAATHDHVVYVRSVTGMPPTEHLH
jgi:hypothetical protein